MQGKAQLTMQAGRLRDRRSVQDMVLHLALDHNHRVFIGKVFDIHLGHYPDCEITSPIFKSTDPRNTTEENQ